MKLRKAAALPGAIMLCVLLLVMSVTVSTFVIRNATNTTVNNAYDQKLLTFANYFNKFKQTGDTSLITDTRYTLKIYDSENNIKALTASEKVNNELVFYCIYDFTNDKTLAYQTSDFYIEEIAGVSYLAGIVPMVEE